MKLHKLLTLVTCLVVSATVAVGCSTTSTTSTPEPTTEQVTTQDKEEEKTVDVTTLNTDVVIVGAGGGGFFIFYIQPEKRTALKEAMKDLLNVPFHFEDGGTRVIHYTPESYVPREETEA